MKFEVDLHHVVNGAYGVPGTMFPNHPRLWQAVVSHNGKNIAMTNPSPIQAVTQAMLGLRADLAQERKS